jgi:tetratricopeptide (TPR) repeat protein
LGLGLLLLLLSGAGGVLAWSSWKETPTLSEINRLLARRKFTEAERGARAYVFWHPSDAEGWFTLARSRAGGNDFQGCVAALERVPDDSPRKPEALLRAGQTWQRLGRGRAVEVAFRACFGRNRGGRGVGMDARFALLALLAQEERTGAFQQLALDSYEEIDRSDPRRLTVLTMRMRIQFEQSQPEINIRALKPYVAGDPSDADALAGLAAALDRSGDTTEARRLYAAALELEPADPELRERYLDLLHRLGDTQTMETVLTQRAAETETRPATLKFLAIVAEARGDLGRAAGRYRRAIAAAPHDPELHHRLAAVLFRLRQTGQAQAEAALRVKLRAAQDQLRHAWDRYADAYDRDPSNVDPDLLLGMAGACEACGMIREAQAWYSQVLEVRPEDVGAPAHAEPFQSPTRGIP